MEKAFGVVYLLWNKINGKRYVGQTTQTLKQRMSGHLSDDLYVDRAIRKYGIENFYCGIIKTCATKAELDECERHFIAVLYSKKPYGYNVAAGGGGTVGCKPTPEQRAKNSEAHTGKRHTPETCAKISAATSGENNPMFGKKHTPETRAKLSEIQRGNKKNLGKHPTDETRAKLSAAKSGKNNPFYGKHHTPETRAKLSAANSGENHPLFGQHLSPEYCSKISIANRAGSPYPNLIAEIDAHHLSYTALAKLMGFTSHKSIAPKIAGKQDFTDSDKIKLPEILGKPIEYLLARDDGTTCEEIPASKLQSPYQNLLREMEARQISCSQLAELFGLAYSTVVKKMRGNANFTERDKIKLVEIFGKPIDYLLARFD